MAASATTRPSYITLSDETVPYNAQDAHHNTQVEHFDDVSSADDSDDFIADSQGNEDEEDLVGISIGRAQDLMKSPTTPAAQKIQALEQSRSYFALDPKRVNGNVNDSSAEENTSGVAAPIVQANEPVKGVEFQAEPAGDTTCGRTAESDSEGSRKPGSFIGRILSTAGNPKRNRSVSSSSLFDGIRRRMMALSVSDQPETESKANDVPTKTATMNANSLEHTQGMLSRNSADHGQALEATTLDDTVEGHQKYPRVQRPILPRRTTSNQSLYLKRRATGASEFDDFDVYADTSQMVNSRMKAIKDSLADSKLHMPNMSSLKPSFLRNGPEATPDHSIRCGQDLEAPATAVRAALTSRTSKHPALKSALSALTGDLVILGGYRGSVLRESQFPNRQLWIPVRVGVNLRKVDLELGLTDEDELRASDTIVPSGTLSHIGPIDISRRLIRKCQKCRNAKSGKLRIHDWGYDWRVSPGLISDRLLTFLESLPCNQPHVPITERGAWILAHSLGGLITRHVINRRPGLVAGVVFAGTPQGCANILGPLRNGDDVLFSSRVLTAQVNFTLRTSYALLPLSGQCFINKDTGEHYELDFFNAETWREYHLSPCVRRPKHRKEQSKKGIVAGKFSSLNGPFLFGAERSDNESKDHSITSQSSKLGEEIEDTAETVKEAIPDGPMSPTIEGSSQHVRPSVATAVTLDPDKAYEYLDHTLKQTRAFKTELAHQNWLQEQNEYPPMAIIFSKNTPTVYGAKVGSREDIKYDDAFDDLAFAAGDGVVLASAAQLPDGYKCVRGGRVESARGHVGLLGDLEAVGHCLTAIVNARAKGVGLGSYT